MQAGRIVLPTCCPCTAGVLRWYSQLATGAINALLLTRPLGANASLFSQSVFIWNRPLACSAVKQETHSQQMHLPIKETIIGELHECPSLAGIAWHTWWRGAAQLNACFCGGN